MTVGVMVGGHGREWAACVAPATDSCVPSQATGVASSPPEASYAHVAAGEDLPRALSTRAHSARELRLTLAQDKFKQRRRSHEPTLRLQVVAGLLASSDNAHISSWLPLLPLATDVHAESATLSFVHTSEDTASLKVTLTKGVLAGETPSLWFSSEVAAQLGLPFLNFSHIKEGRYVCPECSRLFVAPNPLKLHLAANCDALDPHLLWNRLLTSASRPSPAPWFTPLLTPPKLAPLPSLPVRVKAPCFPSSPAALSGGPVSPGGHKPVSPDSTSCHVGSPRAASPPRSPTAPAPQEFRSAFRRVSYAATRHENPPTRFRGLLPPGPSRYSVRTPPAGPFMLGPSQSATTPELLLHPRMLMMPSRSEAATVTQPMMPVMPLAGSARPLLSAAPPNGPVDPCAEMETLVSNLGRSRRGHLCLYCGKVYSRKYGLKIHIRTHTGYKPLKCKVCLRPFGDPSNLNKHVRLHAEGETPYRCDHCGKVLVRRRDLDRHIRSRHPEVPTPATQSLSDTEEDEMEEGEAMEEDGTMVEEGEEEEEEEEEHIVEITQAVPSSETR